MPSLPRYGAAVATLTGGALFAYANQIEPRHLRVSRFTAAIPNLPTDLDGLKLAFVSDFHVSGPGPNATMTRQALQIVSQEEPDLILLGGDYFDRGRIDGAADTFDQLRSFQHVIGVLGNHEHRDNDRHLDDIVHLLEQRGVCVLRNNSVSVRIRDLNVTIAGTDDPYSGHDDLDATLRGVDRPLVLLSHAPVIGTKLPAGAAGLVLCGHTHGGQIRLSPSKNLTLLDSTWYLDRLNGRPVSPYQRGWHWVRGSLLYITNGVGTTRMPLRFLAPPEVSFIQLSAQMPQSNTPCDSPDRYIETIE